MARYVSLLNIALLIIMLFSCGPNPYYEEYVEVPEEGWQKDSIITFQVQVEDTASPYRIFLNLRTNSDYPYRNIYLFREIGSERGIEFRDTSEYFLADAYGKWLGEGIGELKTHHLSYSPKVLYFKRQGNYTFKVQQAMRTEKLIGVEDIGLSIFKSEN